MSCRTPVGAEPDEAARVAVLDAAEASWHVEEGGSDRRVTGDAVGPAGFAGT